MIVPATLGQTTVSRTTMKKIPALLIAAWFSLYVFQLAVFAETLGSTKTGVSLLTPLRLRCEGMESPLGIDALAPRLSWQLESSARGQRQTAYQVLVAHDAE